MLHVKDITSGTGVDVVYDSVGKDTFQVIDPILLQDSFVENSNISILDPKFVDWWFIFILLYMRVMLSHFTGQAPHLA